MFCLFAGRHEVLVLAARMHANGRVYNNPSSVTNLAGSGHCPWLTGEVRVLHSAPGVPLGWRASGWVFRLF